jgi:hypothetical protein
MKTNHLALAGGALLLILLVAVTVAVFRSRGTTDRADNTPTTGSPTSSPVDWTARVAGSNERALREVMLAALEIGDAAERRRVVGEVALAWINRDLRGFIGFLDEIDGGDLGEAGAIWAVLAPALMDRLPDAKTPEELSSYLAEVVQRLVGFYVTVDPRATLAWARQWLLDDTRQFALATVAAHLAQTGDPSAALPLFQELTPGWRRVEAVINIAAAWSRHDPEAALRWLATLPSPHEQARGMNQVILTVAAADPARAARLVESASADFQREYQQRVERELAALGMNLAETLADPESALDAHDGGIIPPTDSPDLEMLREAAGTVAGSLAQSDPSAALAWAGQLTHPQLRAAATTSALLAWAVNDPAATLRHYYQSGANTLLPQLSAPLYQIWAGTAPQSALAQAETLPTPQARALARQGALQGWMQAAGPQAAAAYTDTLPAGPERDAANKLIVDHLTTADPGAAFDRATRIEAELPRKQALKNAYTHLLATNPQAAAQALALPTLHPTEAATLRKLSKSHEG